MKNLALSLICLCWPGFAGALCFADYKAKQDTPLRLHYGVARIDGECDAAQAAVELAPRLTRHGWDLLAIRGLFDETGLEERKANAAEYFLRF